MMENLNRLPLSKEMLEDESASYQYGRMVIEPPRNVTTAKAMEAATQIVDGEEQLSLSAFAREMGYNPDTMNRAQKRKLLRQMRARDLRNRIGKGVSSTHVSVIAGAAENEAKAAGIDLNDVGLPQLRAAGEQARRMCREAKRDGHSWRTLAKVYEDILREAASIYERMMLIPKLVSFDNEDARKGFFVAMNSARIEHLSCIFGSDADCAAAAEEHKKDISKEYPLIKNCLITEATLNLEKVSVHKAAGTPLFTTKMVLEGQFFGDFMMLAADSSDIGEKIQAAYHRFISALVDSAESLCGTIDKVLLEANVKAKEYLKAPESAPAIEAMKDAVAAAIAPQQGEPSDSGAVSSEHGEDSIALPPCQCEMSEKEKADLHEAMKSMHPGLAPTQSDDEGAFQQSQAPVNTCDEAVTQPAPSSDDCVPLVVRAVVSDYAALGAAPSPSVETTEHDTGESK